MCTFISSSMSFIFGIVAGVLIEYFSNILTDKRRTRERQREETKEFGAVASRMPELMKEMKQDLITYPDRRDFFVLMKGISIDIYDGPSLEYKEEVHSELRSKVTVLENHGYVVDITQKDVPEFRMTEKFVEHLLNLS